MGKHKPLLYYCQHVFGIGLLGSYVAIALHTGSSYAQQIVRLEDWRFNPEALQLEISLSAASQPRPFYLAQPPRIVIDLPDTKLGNVSTRQNYLGAIQSIRISQLNADVTRIVLDLAPGTLLDPARLQLQPLSQQANRWVLRPTISRNNTYLAPGNLPPSPGNFPPTTINQPFSENLPPGIYPPQPSGYLPPGIYPPQPASNFPLNTYGAPPSLSAPSGYTNLPPTTNYSPQVPFVQVPPLAPKNPHQAPNFGLPPAFFPNQPSNYNNTPPSRTPNFPVPNAPNQPYGADAPEVINFGQPLPRIRN
ncbi:AMIN domain-containing protein [Scytonema sp. UIC 10036]|uniref:AMIN domain-containing protein n=1 Tax=Scytonema sp. UIC 10036 TaxID=2304196 RepID=UPI0012DA0A92|nr:AMIN domain-containing protein [Scytonema sp. UIC 10036]MUG99711.1 AMIN domain-containing protein [Scytonema sp. UIC 10036]